MVEAEVVYASFDRAHERDAMTVHSPPPLPGAVARLTHELTEITRDNANRTALLHDRLQCRLAELERVRGHALRATMLAERAADHAERHDADRRRAEQALEQALAERDRLADALAHERSQRDAEHQRRADVERYAGMMSAMPWYAFRRRALLRRVLTAE